MARTQTITNVGIISYIIKFQVRPMIGTRFSTSKESWTTLGTQGMFLWTLPVGIKSPCQIAEDASRVPPTPSMSEDIDSILAIHFIRNYSI